MPGAPVFQSVIDPFGLIRPDAGYTRRGSYTRRTVSDRRARIGTGSGALDPDVIFSDSNIGGVTSLTFTAHIDSLGIQSN